MWLFTKSQNVKKSKILTTLLSNGLFIECNWFEFVMQKTHFLRSSYTDLSINSVYLLSHYSVAQDWETDTERKLLSKSILRSWMKTIHTAATVMEIWNNKKKPEETTTSIEWNEKCTRVLLKSISLSNCIQFCKDEKRMSVCEHETQHIKKDKMQCFMRVWNLCSSNNKG